MKVFLFGSTGMLGRYVHSILKEQYDIETISRQEYDIENDNYERLENIFASKLKKNDVIINCAGIIPQKYEKDDYKTYILVNTLFPHKLSEISECYGAKLIHITTDCVYDGTKGNYLENDKHTAKDIYGVSKSLGEPVNSNTTIIRTSIIGEELEGKKSLIEWIKSNKGGEISGYANHFWNGVTCLTLAKIIKNIIDNDNFWKGLKHIFSENTVSKYDLCCYVNEIYRLNIKINKTYMKDSKNLVLSSVYDNFFQTGTVYNQLIELYGYHS
jgi:dTDP-4-dehydrorhamnose reductase